MTNARSAGGGGKIIRLAYLVAGVIAVAVSLLPRGATLIYLWPWPLILTVALLVPPVVLLGKFAAGQPVLRLGGGADWAALVLLAVATASAWFSPYLSAALSLLLFPLAAVCLIYSAADWFRRDPGADESVAHGLAWLLLAFTAVSLVMWLVLVAVPDHFRDLAGERNPHPLGHSNYTAGAILLLLPFGLVRLREKRARWFWAAACTLAVFCLFIAGSRAALLGLGAGAIAAVAWLVRIGRVSPRRAALLGLAAFAAVVLFAVANPRVRSMLLAPSENVPDDSTIQRSAMAAAGSEMIRARPCIGWGPGTTPLAYPEFRRDVSGGVDTALQLHSAPLQVAVDLGVTGFVAMIALLGAPLLGFWRVSPPANAPAGATAGLAVIAYGVFAIYDYQLDVPLFPAVGALCLALLCSAGKSPRPLPRWPALAAIAVVLALAGGPCFRQLHAHALLSSAVDALEDKDVPTFVERARRAVAADPDGTAAANALALRLGEQARNASDPAERSRNLQEAIPLLELSLARDPEQELCRTNLGWLRLPFDPTAALRDFRAAAKMVPDKEGLWLGQALAQLALGQRDNALASLANECLATPRFLFSPEWRSAPLDALRTDATRKLAERAGQLAEEKSGLKAWQRAELRYVGAVARWLAGDAPAGSVSPVALSARQRDFFASPNAANLRKYLLDPTVAPEAVNFRVQRPGYGVLVRNLDVPMPVDLHQSVRDQRLLADEVVLFPEHLNLPGRVFLEALPRD